MRRLGVLYSFVPRAQSFGGFRALPDLAFILAFNLMPNWKMRLKVRCVSSTGVEL